MITSKLHLYFSLGLFIIFNSCTKDGTFNSKNTFDKKNIIDTNQKIESPKNEYTPIFEKYLSSNDKSEFLKKKLLCKDKNNSDSTINAEAQKKLIYSIELYNEKNKLLSDKFDVFICGFYEEIKNTYLPLSLINLIKSFCWDNSTFIKKNTHYKVISEQTPKTRQKLIKLIEQVRFDASLIPLKESYNIALSKKRLDNKKLVDNKNFVDEIIYLYPIMKQTARLLVCIEKYIDNKQVDDVVKLLNNLEFEKNYVKSIFIYAILQNSMELVKVIIDKHSGQVICQEEHPSESFITIALQNFCFETIKYIDKVFQSNIFEEYLDILAKSFIVMEPDDLDEKIVDLLYKENVIYKYYNETTLLYNVAINGKIHLFDILLKKGVSLFFANGFTILDAAAIYHQNDFIKHLSTKESLKNLCTKKDPNVDNILFNYWYNNVTRDNMDTFYLLARRFGCDQIFEKDRDSDYIFFNHWHKNSNNTTKFNYDMDTFYLLAKHFGCNINEQVKGKLFINIYCDFCWEDDNSLSIWYKNFQSIIENLNPDLSLEDSDGYSILDKIYEKEFPAIDYEDENIFEGPLFNEKNILGGPQKLKVVNYIRKKLKEQETKKQEDLQKKYNS